MNIRSIIRITERGRTASLAGSWQREARWQIIKAHDGPTVRAYLMNTGNLGLEALRRRMGDGWVELDELDRRWHGGIIRQGRYRRTHDEAEGRLLLL